MNIFYLSEDPVTAARYHCDKHVVKMILETAQLLCTAHRVLDGDDYADLEGLYKAAFKNHPCAVWVRESKSNYMYAYELFVALLTEYKLRYGKIHACDKFVDSLSYTPVNTEGLFLTPPAQCMPDEYKHSDPVIAYRQYYCGEKARFAKWKNGGVPSWFSNLIAA
jgi:hypothetical protein